MRRKRAVIALVALAAITVGGLLIPIGATPEVYAAVTGAIQAFGVVMALAIAIFAQSGEISDRKVDRVLGLHQELTSGPTGDARTRLGWFYRARRSDGLLPTLTRADLHSATYQDGQQSARTPRLDSDRVLRFFERVNAARLRGSLDDYTAALLLGRHATWWNRAIAAETPDPTRSPLASMADWATAYAVSHADDEGFQDWNARTDLDFGTGSLARVSDPRDELT